MDDSRWKVKFTKQSTKQKSKLPKKAQGIVDSLQIYLEKLGPLQPEWPNFTPLNKKAQTYHCHLNKRGHPTYVATWQVVDKEIKIIEIYYVGTREGAPYA